MRRLVLSIVFMCAAAIVASAQAQLDSIFLRRGDIIVANLTKFTQNKIEFVYPNETMVNIADHKELRRIVTKTGRVIDFSMDDMNDENESFAVTELETAHLRRMGEVGPLSEAKVVRISEVIVSNTIRNMLTLDEELFCSRYLDNFTNEMNTKFSVGPVKPLFTMSGNSDVEMIIHLVNADPDGEVTGYAVFTKNGNEFLRVWLNGNGGIGKSFDAKLVSGAWNVTNRLLTNLIRQY